MSPAAAAVAVLLSMLYYACMYTAHYIATLHLRNRGSSGSVTSSDGSTAHARAYHKNGRHGAFRYALGQLVAALLLMTQP
eukprot:17825-Heterococcus_DN1.PRE.2